MDEYAGRVLADRYRLPLPPSDEYELASEVRAFDTYSGQEVLVRQVPLPEVVEAEMLDADGLPEGYVARDGGGRRGAARTTRRSTDPAVGRAIEAAQAAAQIPDHPRLDQVFDVFAEGGSLWIVSELVSARPLAALLAEQPLTPYRAAEIASDVLTALRALHAHGWVHRNITARTVLVCDDGRVMLTGLAAGAAEEALCGYDPVPVREFEDSPPGAPGGGAGVPAVGSGRGQGPRHDPVPPGGVPGARGASAPGGALPGGTGGGTFGGSRGGGPGGGGEDPEAARRAAIEARAGSTAAPGTDPSGGQRALEAGGDARAARAGAIAAYRAGARAAARVQDDQLGGPGAGLPAQRPAPQDGTAAGAGRDGDPASGAGARPMPLGQIADPYGVLANGGATSAWHGALPRGGTAAPGGNGRGTAAPGASSPYGGGPPRGASGGDGRGDDTFDGGDTGTHPTPGHGSRRDPGYGDPTYDTAAHGDPAYGVGAHTGSVQDTAAPHSTGVTDAALWDGAGGGAAPRRGPATALAAERARQARMAVVGPVTERWAPEQAGPVHENWQLAAPIGPSTDLWALGALLFRAVQGHAPYPEENTAELVQMVCAEPPAFAEECGPLRPVVESLLRQDPIERLDFEELRGWLRSLVRSAPEPEAGAHVVPTPPVDASRLPIVRRRGELVRRRRAGLPATSAHARHKRTREKPAQPRKLGRNLLLLILLALVAAVTYAMVFMPKAAPSSEGGDTSSRTDSAGQQSSAPVASSEPRPDQNSNSPDGGEEGQSGASPSESSGATQPQTGDSEVAQGFTLRKDPEGFQVAVADGWDRSAKNGRGQIVYSQGDFELILVPGRDRTATYGRDPLKYQREDERELQPFRDSSWATSTGMRLIEVGGVTSAEGQFTWQDSEGRGVYVRNLVILLDGRYHVVQLRGPEAERDEVTRLYEQAADTYKATG
ncbi:protein kinase [Streptomyces europaeiscabiei]|uniref:protein kinase n=1 Tax=Streptomyces europaeiscabiei TaxID=146819 RepID=UPI0029BA6D2E|nr:protein kinase [Streptomyces europaeiscabiei]MDX2525633.1 protein kinase [Streptomyces europaeiscabiei]MDX3667531.1 protein kinase [Streptomyces europaeiscabiei]MDX3708631.1 protein kinase [Streptomyces europaeiscabiei]MDX3842790.1 protein kinase [Streptomyces europaeiscabiei]